LEKFSLRVISAVFLILFALFATFKGGIVFLILIFFFLIFSLLEFLKVLYERGFLLNPIIIFFLNILFFFLFLKNSLNFEIFLLYFVFSFLISFFFALKRTGVSFLSYAILVFFYITIPAFLFYQIRTEWDIYEVLFLLFNVWVFDSFSYIVGTKFGKRKLWERVSQKKTVEGFLGGMGSVILFSLVFSLIFDLDIFLRIFSGFLIALGALAGDLWESVWKREMGIKDSSHLIPGHGGFLDRIDSLLFGCYIYYFILNYIL